MIRLTCDSVKRILQNLIIEGIKIISELISDLERGSL